MDEGKKDIKYQVKKKIATISGNNTANQKLLTMCSWNDRPAKLDLRSWRQTDEGKVIPGKGVTLTNAEAKELVKALNQYLTDL